VSSSDTNVKLVLTHHIVVYWGLGKKGWNVHLSDYFPHISLVCALYNFNAEPCD